MEKTFLILAVRSGLLTSAGVLQFSCGTITTCVCVRVHRCKGLVSSNASECHSGTSRKSGSRTTHTYSQPATNKGVPRPPPDRLTSQKIGASSDVSSHLNFSPTAYKCGGYCTLLRFPKMLERLRTQGSARLTLI